MTNRLIHGDCLNTPLPPDHFDTLITDPPYGLGFMGKDWDAGVPGKVFWKKFLDACKPGAVAFVFGGTRTFHRLTCAIEDAGWEIRDCMMWLYGSGFPKSLDISKAIDKAKGAERESLGKDPNRAGRLVNQMEHSNPTGTWQAGKRCVDITNPATDLAKLWDGWGTALKPAWEPIIVAMKPLDGTFAHNAEKWGIGGLWIDGGRIETNEVLSAEYGQPSGSGCYNWNKEKKKVERTGKTNTQGRWPANIILDEEAGAILDEQSGRNGSNKTVRLTRKRKGFMLSGSENNVQEANSPDQYGDSGGASRFFYCAKAGKKERNDGLNNHPTVKPLALMEYLCRLSRPPQGGIVLDPFAGSGTTALACANTDRQYVVVEKEREYCEITAARLGGIPIEVNIPQRPRLL